MVLILNGYPDFFKREYVRVFRRKLGLDHLHSGQSDFYLIQTLLQMMEDQKTDFTLTFRQLSSWKLSDIRKHHVPPHLWALAALSPHARFSEWCKNYASAVDNGELNNDLRKSRMDRVNPRYILRNWIAQQVITQVEKHSFDLLRKVHRILKQPFTEQEEA